MSKKEDIRGKFIGKSPLEVSEKFEFADGDQFYIKPMTVKDAKDWEENEEKRLDPDKESKTHLEMTIDLIIRTLIDGDGERIFHKRDKKDLMDTPLQDENLQSIMDAFNEVNSGAEIDKETGETDLDYPDSVDNKKK